MGCSATKTIQSESGSDRSNDDEVFTQTKDIQGSYTNSTPRRSKVDKSSANNNSNNRLPDGKNMENNEKSPSSGRNRTHRPAGSSPLCNSKKQTSQSQTDFFKMLDEKIEQGKDYSSQASREEDGIT